MDEAIAYVIGAALLFLYPTWRIYRRAGLLPPLSIVVLIPYFGVFLTALLLAVCRWRLSPAGAK